MSLPLKSTNWTKGSISSVNWTKGLIKSSGWTKSVINSGNWEPAGLFSESGLLLQNGIDFLLLQNNLKIGLQV